VPQTVVTHPRKLSVGDKIRTNGWPLPGLKDGRVYRVAYIDYVRGHPCYGFRLNRGRRKGAIIRHFCNHIDPWIGRETPEKTVTVI
jgi:hypothetical protein